MPVTQKSVLVCHLKHAFSPKMQQSEDRATKRKEAIRQDINDELVTYCDNLKNNNDKNVNVCKFFHHILTGHCELFNTDLTCIIK